MTESNQRRHGTNQQDLENDAIDRRLDAVLSNFAAVEPRAGLENRVLANLRAQSEQAPERGWWRWAAVGTLAMVVMMLVVFLSWRTRKPQLVKAPAHVTKQDVGSNQAASNLGLLPHHAASVKTAVTNRTGHSAEAAAVAPHLPQFPSPEAISDQEKMLADYAAEYHEQAVLIARFNEEDLRRDRMELIENAQMNTNVTKFENEENKPR
jgi:hypothetical protein